MSFNDDNKKWIISLISAIVFIIISAPQTFIFTNTILENVCIKTIDEECEKPTYTGIIVHGIVFMLITRLLMEYNLHDKLIELYTKK